MPLIQLALRNGLQVLPFSSCLSEFITLYRTFDSERLVHLHAVLSRPGLRGSGALRFLVSYLFSQGCLLNSLIDDDTLSFFSCLCLILIV